MKNRSIFLLFIFIFLNNCPSLSAQKSSIIEEVRILKTYPFSDPDPVPILVSNPKIYPYFKYEGYSHEGQNQDWKVVKLENKHVEVFVLPEVGGKVWGAIEKSTGQEFIYRNEVMKFRNISMRGPWTSGGIEFNFGIIGHHPSTATPVDYLLKEEADGSVSCIVGNIDLPSRTQWRVKIRLPKGKAAFETEALWYNPTAMNQAYYNWMTGAAPARPDFEFFTPGDELLKHSGEAQPWPMDDMGRNIALYKENNFGSSKSYHIVGEYNDFFGGYYQDAQYGFGHWGEYEAIPGQKLWLWALSRSGGIWEDLLTDTDGQYIEFQAGRQFLQYAPGGHDNPQTQANFEPYSADQWREVWFPIKEIGGLSDVSEEAVLHVEEANGELNIGMNAFIEKAATLQVLSEGKALFEQALKLKPMEIFKQKVKLDSSATYEVLVKELDLHYTSNPDDLLIKRPFHSDDLAPMNSNQKLYKAAWEDMKYRLYAEATEKFEAVLKVDPYHIDAMLGLGELYYRQGLYDKGLEKANQALKLDTYHAKANYIAGILYRAKGDYLNAKEALGWAARSMQYRSNAFAQIGEILLAEGQYTKAQKYASKALNFNRFNINAWQVKAIAARKQAAFEEAERALKEIEKIDPLHHFVKMERYLISGTEEDKKRFIAAHRSELVAQTFLELAIDYFNKGQKAAAIEVLNVAPQHPLIDLWWVYIQKDTESKYLKALTTLSPELVFPFRRETLAALEWANKELNHWKLKYYYALNLWGKNRKTEAASIFKKIGNTPDYAPFYLARAHFLKENRLVDLEKAYSLAAKDWQTGRALTAYYLETEAFTEALDWSSKVYTDFPENYAVGMDYAKALNHNKEYEKSIAILNELKVLPFEGASAGRQLYEEAHYGQALHLIHSQNYTAAIPLLEKAKSWPENLGVGKPFNPDERIANYLLAHCHQKQGNRQKAVQLWSAIANYAHLSLERNTFNHLLSLKAVEYLEGENKAKVLLQTLLNTADEKAIVKNWVAARFLDNVKKMQALEVQKLNKRQLVQANFIMQVYLLD